MGWIRVSACAAACSIAAAAAAHDFWLQLDGYLHAAPGAPIALEFLIGEAKAPEAWALHPERVVGLRSYGPSGMRDHQTAIETGKSEPGDARITLDEAGSHVIAFESTPSVSELPADEFAGYVEHEGLTAVAAHRDANGSAKMPGRELYARRAKAIVQIGPRATANVLEPVGQSLEILPVVHPHAARAGPLGFRILFRGKPLSGALIKCERLDGSRETLAAVRSDSDGRAACVIAREGNWKISSVWSVPIGDTRRADYDTLFASLTFGY